MNLLECIITVIISATIACLAFFYWDNLLASYAVNQDAQLLAKTFKSTQIRAMASHQTTRLCGDEHCSTPLGDNVVMVPDVGDTYHTALSGKTHLITRAFPASKSNQFIFTPQGMTDFQNASIYVCSNTSSIAIQLRINQAGRVVVDKENVYKEC
jgi:Tfp pilus assembly protein FimT